MAPFLSPTGTVNSSRFHFGCVRRKNPPKKPGQKARIINHSLWRIKVRQPGHPRKNHNPCCPCVFKPTLAWPTSCTTRPPCPSFWLWENNRKSTSDHNIHFGRLTGFCHPHRFTNSGKLTGAPKTVHFTRCPKLALFFCRVQWTRSFFLTWTKRSLPPALHVNPHHPQQTNHLFLLHLPPALPTIPLFPFSSLRQARGVPLAASKNKKVLHVFHNTRHNPQARFGTTQLYKNRQQVPQRALLRPVEQRGSPVLYQIRSHAGTCSGATRRHDRRRAHQPIGTIPRNHATLWPQPSSCLCTDRMQ